MYLNTMKQSIGKYQIEKILKCQKAQETCLVISPENKSFISKTFETDTKEIMIKTTDCPITIVQKKNSSDSKTNFPEHKLFKTLQKINHKNIVRFQDCFLLKNGGRVALIVEYCRGGSLDQHLGNISEQKVHLIIAELVEALFCLHSNNIIHKNINIHNIFFDQHKTIKIAEPSFHLSNQKNAKPTTSDPIQNLEKNQYSKYSDIFALGIVILELLLGKRIFELVEGNKKPCSLANSLSEEMIAKISDWKYRNLVLGMLNKKLNIKQIKSIIENNDIFMWNQQLVIISYGKGYYKGESKYGDRQGKGFFISPAGWKYVGQWKNDFKNGWGIEVLKDKYQANQFSEYTGQFANNERNGKGIQKESRWGRFYEGDWKNNMKDGRGIEIVRNRSIYEGDWVQNIRHGKGFAYDGFHQGSQLGFYHGSFRHNLRDGKGVCSWKNGKRYEGDWSQGKINGKGICYYANASIYDGDWVNGQKHGHGVLFYQNGAKHDGNWIKDQFTGFGIEISINGDKYEGNWINFRKNGKGILFLANGGIYDGSWVNNQMNGKGILLRSNGKKYDGQWVNNRMNGKGILFERNGDRFEGQWVNHEKSGKGTCFYVNGDRLEGTWVNNQLNGHVTYFYANGGQKSGQWINNRIID